MDFCLEVKNLTKTFHTSGRTVEAVRNISFTAEKGKVLGIAGESGSGKSTLARLITQVIPPDTGTILINGKDYSAPDASQMRELHRQIQMVFQNPAGSFDPRRKIGDTILDSVMNFRIAGSRADGRQLIREHLDRVGLSQDVIDAYPREISGGQCQRAAIVRAVIVKPEILILDEATSALDVLVQKQIMELLARLKTEEKITMLFISHDLALIGSFADDVLIMKEGEVVESGRAATVISSPQHPYTQRLIASIL